ncbi:hypothetical protein J2S49_001219 [Arcanobacterium wilhelmae]|uniref:Uncharacterized protein n=1 Tax=Arcanobacterium wilhelmae TaxID=1803177 RepID=A0ABT9NBP8_9ACTO|nr:hypothetical protein [Arcanobacterium wilhelmae]
MHGNGNGNGDGDGDGGGGAPSDGGVSEVIAKKCRTPGVYLFHAVKASGCGTMGGGFRKE